MKESRKKLNLIDYLIIFSIILIICSSILQNIAVSKFEEKNIFEDTVITLRILNADESVVDEIEKGDYIFSANTFGEESFGIVDQKTKYSSSEKDTSNESNGTEIVEYEIQVLAECLKNSNSFYSINDKTIAPGMKFSADNGFVGFECEVVSVKTVD